jgi:hypothetical protein
MESEFSQAQTGDTLQAAIDGSPKMQAALQMQKAMDAGGAQHPNAVYQRMADRRARLSGGPVLQRYVDSKDVQVTEAMIAAENNLQTLIDWRDNGKSESWEEEDPERAMIIERIAVLEGQAAAAAQAAQAAQAAAQVAAKKAEFVAANGGQDIPNFNYQVALLLQLPRYSWASRVHFFAQCQAEAVDPMTAYTVLDNAAGNNSEHLAIALTGFMKEDVKISYALAQNIAANVGNMLAVTKDDADVDQLLQWIAAGWITVGGGLYKDKFNAKAFAFVFRFAGTNTQLNFEWHGHLGAQDKIDAASFKDQKMAVGQGVRRDTSVAENQKLLQVCKF